MRQIFCLLAFLAALACAQEAGPGRGVNFYSIEKEVALGRQLAAEFEREHPPVADPAVQSRINDIGQRLAAHSGNSLLTYTFTLIADDPTVGHEPPAFPGGFVFVPERMIVAAKDDNELAGMLAHSMAHIAARHGTKEATRAELGQISTMMIYMGGDPGSAMRRGSEMALPVKMRALHRSQELEADSLAVRMMAGAGYNPAGLARYIEREQTSDDVPGSAMPSRAERLAVIQAAIAGLPK